MTVAWHELAGMGFSVFPLRAKSKVAALEWDRFQRERPISSELNSWSAHSAYNAGIATGAVSGVFVLDLDSAEAIAEAERRGLPDTLAVDTAKGRHVYFRHPGGKIGNRARFLPGMDIRGDGGYVVAPGSIHPDGPVYSWRNPPGLFSLEDAPQWLFDALEKPEKSQPEKSATSKVNGSATAYGEAALDGILSDLRRAPEGERNNALNKAAFRCGQIDAASGINAEQARRLLHATALAIGLDEAEIGPTIESGWTDGRANPRGASAHTFRGAPTQAETENRALTILDPSNWHGEAPPAREWAVSEWIPLKQATYLTGKGSAGKSLLAQQLATCISLGLPFLGQRTKEAPAFYITAEDDADELWRRQAAICRSLNITLSALHDRLHLVSLAGEVGNELVTFDERGKLRIEPRFHQIEAAVAGHDGAFIALDNVAHFTADEIKRSSVAGFMSMLNRLAMSVDGSVLILGHPNKVGAEFSGSTAWENQVRSRLYLETPTDEHGAIIDRDARVLTRSKSNYARNGEQITFRWHEWAFVRDDDLPAHIRQTIADTVTAGAENAAFLECLAVCTEKQRAVSHVPGVNYAPRVFAKMPEAKRYPENRLAGAMERLWNMGVILFDQQLWRDTHRHWKTGIARAEKCGDPPAGTPCGDPELSDCNSLREPCGGDPPYTTYKGAPSHEVGAPSSFEPVEW